MRLTVEFDRETDGRWIASVPELAGVHVYGESRDQALAKVLSLAYSVLAVRLAVLYDYAQAVSRSPSRPLLTF